MRNGSLKILARALKRLKKYRLRTAAAFCCAASGVAAQLIAPILAGRAIDGMVYNSARVPRGVIFVLFVYGCAALVNAAAGWIAQTISIGICAKAARDLRDEAAFKLRTLPFSYLDSRLSGDILNRITIDVETFSDGLLMVYTQFFPGILTIMGTLGFMLATNYTIGLTVALVTPLSLFSAAFISQRCFCYFRVQSDARGNLTACAGEFIEGADIVDAFAHENEAGAGFAGLDAKFSAASVKATFFGSITNPVARFVNGIVYTGVALTGALTPGMTVGALSYFLSYANQYTKPFNEISGVIAELQNAAASAGRIFEMLDQRDEPAEYDGAKGLVPDGSVNFNNVSFSYNPDARLIRDFNFAVEPGMHVAIVGPTGCGKTTLINLLMRFYDVDLGAIEVAGHDIRKLTRGSLRRGFGMVLQDTWLVPGTVKENIAYGNPQATDREIIAAAAAAHAESFIRRLPQGIDTVLDENGGGLSQGQKQLLCIARVMLRLPPMLILDEATSSIDTRTELRIQKAFARLAQGKTSFIVAHRLSTVRDADIILVMNKGEIIEQGCHEELLGRGGFYAKLYNSQFDNA